MISLVIVLAVAYIAHFYWKISRYPKGPFPIPFFGNALQVEPNNLQGDLEKWRKTYGDVFTIWLLNRPIVAFMRTDVVKEALVTKGDIFANRTGEFPEDLFMTTENGGVIFSSGENWREQRRTALHILRDFGVGKNVMEEQIHEQVELFVKRVKANEDKERFEFRWPVQVLVANIINQLLYGSKYPHDDCKQLMDYADTISSIFSGLWESAWMLVIQAFPIAKNLPYIGYQAAGRHIEKFNWCVDFVKRDVKEALKNYSKEDEPHCFVQAYFQKMDTNSSLTMDQLYNVCSDFFMAGMETTSTTLRWAVLYLAKYPEMQEKLRQEIANIVGFDRLTSLRDKNDLPYTTAFIAELQRVSNIVAINLLRKTTEDVVIDGKFIPIGTNVLPHVYGANLDEKRYPNATSFNPDRFVNKDGTLNSDLISQLIIFGAGKRQCAGESLARAELFLGLTAIVQKFKIQAPLDKEIDFSPVYGTVIFPKTNYLRIEDVDPLQYM